MILAKTANIEPENTFIRGILIKVGLYKERVEIILCKQQLMKGLGSIITGDTLMDDAKSDTEDTIKITKNIRISTTSRNGSVIVYNNAENAEPTINPFLVKTIAKSYYWNKLLDEGKANNSIDIQRMEGHNNSTYIKEVLRLKFLAPNIVESILEGTQPKDLTLDKLRKIKTLDWQEQKRILNFE